MALVSRMVVNALFKLPTLDTVFSAIALVKVTARRHTRDSLTVDSNGWLAPSWAHCHESEVVSRARAPLRLFVRSRPGQAVI